MARWRFTCERGLSRRQEKVTSKRKKYNTESESGRQRKGAQQRQRR